MTERTVRMQAKEFAGIFYHEDKRSAGFRAAFPTFKDYMRGHQHMPDGTIQQIDPGWQHHLGLARKTLAIMLGQPDSKIHPNVKNAIFDALIEDRNRQLAAHQSEKKAIHQVGIQPHDA